jgi:hypothetical protein
MAYGVVLRPDPAVSRQLIALSHEIGAAHDPLMLLGDQAPPHVSVLHVDSAPPFATIPTGALRLTMASGPFGTFPDLTG